VLAQVETDLEAYIADHYGTCKLSQYDCHVKIKCVGTRACPNWIPMIGVKSWDELAALELARHSVRTNQQ
jgi:hypothetical protein